MNKNSFFRRLYTGLHVLYNTYIASLDRSKFGYCADDVYLCPPLTFSNPKNVFLYKHTNLKNAIIFSNNAKFIMEPYAGVGEGLRVSTGNHAMEVGKMHNTIRDEEKPDGLDKDIIIESDAWLGRNVTLLSGVRVGRGSVVGAGAVVTKDIPPYTVCVGVPAKPIKFKWSIEEILRHENLLYEANERYSKEQLEHIFNEVRDKFGI